MLFPLQKGEFLTLIGLYFFLLFSDIFKLHLLFVEIIFDVEICWVVGILLFAALKGIANLLFHFQNHALHQINRKLNCINVKTFKKAFFSSNPPFRLIMMTKIGNADQEPTYYQDHVQCKYAKIAMKLCSNSRERASSTSQYISGWPPKRWQSGFQ